MFRKIGLVVLAAMALLAVGTLTQNGRGSHSPYATAIGNLTVASAHAADCVWGQHCTNGLTGHCVTGQDPNEGCKAQPLRGCFYCYIPQ